jgi:hypothetical protein
VATTAAPTIFADVGSDTFPVKLARYLCAWSGTAPRRIMGRHESKTIHRLRPRDLIEFLFVLLFFAFISSSLRN